MGSNTSQPDTDQCIPGSFPAGSIAAYTGPHIPVESDVFTLRKLFLDLLPPELIEEIIHFANYWPLKTTSYVVNRHFDGQPTDNFVDWCYMVTPSLQLQGGSVVTVEFRIKSGDQGWGGPPGCQGSYLFSSRGFVFKG